MSRARALVEFRHFLPIVHGGRAGTRPSRNYRAEKMREAHCEPRANCRKTASERALGPIKPRSRASREKIEGVRSCISLGARRSIIRARRAIFSRGVNGKASSRFQVLRPLEVRLRERCIIARFKTRRNLRHAYLTRADRCESWKIYHFATSFRGKCLIIKVDWRKG